MKNVLLSSLILVFGSLSSASESAKSIYQALSIEAKNTCTSPVCPNSLETLKKTLNGLECSETTYMSPGTPVKYSCSITSNVDAKQIYGALRVEAKNACTSPVCPDAEMTMIKSAKGIKCKETTKMSPGNPTSYNCVFSF